MMRTLRNAALLALVLLAAAGYVRPVAGETAERLLSEPLPDVLASVIAPQPAPEPAEPIVPAELADALARRGLTAEDLPGSQLVLVTPDGNEAAVTCYRRDSAGWAAVEGLTAIPGHVGRNGVNDDRRMGDGTTPTGLYDLGLAFGKEPRPDTEMPWRDITEQSYWTGDDTELLWYNRWVERDQVPADADIDWRGSEHLVDHKSYTYCVLIEFNTGADKSSERGFAIFFHSDIGTPTQGCVSIPEAQMKAVIEWLKPDAAPQILIDRPAGA